MKTWHSVDTGGSQLAESQKPLFKPLFFFFSPYNEVAAQIYSPKITTLAHFPLCLVNKSLKDSNHFNFNSKIEIIELNCVSPTK